MSVSLYKCIECGWVLEAEDGKKPEVCEKCGAHATIVPLAQDSGHIGCVNK